LVILRDPVDRFRSGLSHQLANGSTPTSDTVSDAVNRGFYNRHLAWWAEHFNEEHILVLQYELCARDPIGQLSRTYRFLGLDDSFRPENIQQRRSSSFNAVPIGPEVAGRLKEIYAEDVASLLTNLPELDVSLWTHFSRRPA
jgi:hypothetical protein